MGQLWVELRERKLVQWVAAYLAAAWLVLQVLDLVGEQFGWPRSILQSVTVLLAVGFLGSVVLAWYHGEKGAQRMSAPEMVMMTALVIIAGGVIWLIRGEPGPAVSAADASPADSPVETVEEGSVVVLPFANISGEEEQEYFSDGITEEILNALARVPGLRVPARTSSFAFKGKNIPVREIADQLSVAHVLEGSVRKSGSRLRINAQLVDARSDRQLWSESYDRELEDVFAVQEEIALAIAGALRMRLGADEIDPNEVRPTRSQPAYESYLKGRYFANRRTLPDLERAVELFQRATTLDSNFAMAHAGLAQVHAILPSYGYRRDRQTESLNQAMAAAQRALELDGGTSDAYAALGFAHMELREWTEAGAAYQRAIESDPGNATARQWYGQYLCIVGRPEEGLRELARARDLDPLSLIINRNFAVALHHERHYEAAVGQVRRTLDLDPGFPQTEALLALTYARMGRHDEAVRAAEKLIAQPRGTAPANLAELAMTFAIVGQLSRARDFAREWEAAGPVGQATRASVAVALGEPGRALQILEEMPLENVRGLSVWALARSPALDPIRSDPRYIRMLEQLGVSGARGEPR